MTCRESSICRGSECVNGLIGLSFIQMVFPGDRRNGNCGAYASVWSVDGNRHWLLLRSRFQPIFPVSLGPVEEGY